MAPLQPTTIPGLELCSAVLSSQSVKKLLEELNLPIHEVVFYTDSKVALGYIQNDSRRFYVGVAAEHLKDSRWLRGPEFLREASPNPLSTVEAINQSIALDLQDPEVRSQVITYTTDVVTIPGLGAERFSRFSSFTSLRRALANLIVMVKERKAASADHIPKHRTNRTDNRVPSEKLPKRIPRPPSATELMQAEMVMIRTVQNECFADEIKLLEGAERTEGRDRSRQRKNLLKKSSLYSLDPFGDTEGVLRVGGRLRRSHLSFLEKHPFLLPKGHHLSRLIVRHQHEKTHHQGRHITHGAVRTAGFWVTGGHGELSKVISSCVICRRLRGTILIQHMADLPSDRTETPRPFTNVGCDVFGPW
ncbi:uncharacterized protein LOC111345347 [Stylophora pistillata]|uniref:uncharacterized protein LOC111345347 n=1 Tax=Stylophora pistillata TaxID=50429 RepID=UPI000C05209D|nr:uncharacterized protein LOC111345347 [Stylophora pistillata]